MSYLDALKLTVTSSVTVGKAEQNYVSFVLENTGTDSLQRLILSLRIPVGQASGEDTFLLQNTDDNITVESSIESDVPDRSRSTELQWRTPSRGFLLDPGAIQTVTLKNFTPPGEGSAPVYVSVAPRGGEARVFPQSIEAKAAKGVAILSLKASPVYARSGQQVTLSGYATNAKSCTLFRNDQRLDVTLDPANIRYTAPVTAPTTFRIDVSSENPPLTPAPAGSTDSRSVFVNVEPSGTWASRNLLLTESGSQVDISNWHPTLLLPAQDLRGGPSQRLYGVFKEVSSAAARLYSSTSGVDGWRYEADIPEGMEESPGVIHDGKLWLIGGSSWDPEKPKLRRVACWYKGTDGSMAWKIFSGNFAARNCHACASFNNRIYVLGGINSSDNPINDVVTAASSQNADEVTLEWSAPATAPWGARSLPAVVVSTGQFSQPRLWVYGGTPDPVSISPFVDLWYLTPDGTWDQMQRLPEAGLKPLGSTLLYDDSSQTLYLAGVFTGVNDKPGLYSVSSTIPLAWASEPVAFPWRFSQQDMFLMRSVQFDGRRIFWPLYYRYNSMPADWRQPRIYTL